MIRIALATAFIAAALVATTANAAEMRTKPAAAGAAVAVAPAATAVQDCSAFYDDYARRGWGWGSGPGTSVGFGTFEGALPRYSWIVDVGLAGILGVGLYFHASGRTWCRFACPLAALMHVYARFSSFRIVADKKKCISCNACTSVCHQGIDVMSFAQRGRPMDDPQCVRCSACVESCPTGVLQFGRVSPTGALIAVDALWVSPVIAAETSAGVTSPSAGTPSSAS